MNNNKFVNQILREYEKRRDEAFKQQKTRQAKVYRKIPRIKEIDNIISKTGLKITKSIINNPSSYNDSLNRIRNEIEELKREKAILLTDNNIPVDFLDIKYECPKCNDTGFTQNGKKCSCFKQKLINKYYKMSNIENLLARENFQTFNSSIFLNEPYNGNPKTPRENIMDIFNVCEDFCNNFGKDNVDNLLFYGTTGLGKTFMCNCIAKALLDIGKIVIYQTAFKILQIIKDYEFNQNYNSKSSGEYDLLFDADLLIIDDLGTEITSSFSNAQIFNIVNSRLIKQKKTIISTNLSPKEIADTYSDRIFSRIFSEFTPLKFYGPDLRWEKK